MTNVFLCDFLCLGPCWYGQGEIWKEGILQSRILISDTTLNALAYTMLPFFWYVLLLQRSPQRDVNGHPHLFETLGSDGMTLGVSLTKAQTSAQF